MIVAQPNLSANWRANRWVLLALAVPSMSAATAFALLGAWPILPLMGLELVALGSALYYVNWKLRYRHVITFSDDSVCIEKGFCAPSRSWRFPRRMTALAVTTEDHPWEGPALSVHDERECVSVGEFLNRDDSLKLLALLRREVQMSTCGDRGLCEF
jgi:uncharacterized membrane protein